MPSTVTVHYPFHPLHNCCLGVIAWPRRATGAATVQHPDGKPLKIPVWMLQPDASKFSAKPRMAVMGVRISWLIFAKNSLLARLAESAASLANRNSLVWSSTR